MDTNFQLCDDTRNINDVNILREKPYIYSFEHPDQLPLETALVCAKKKNKKNNNNKIKNKKIKTNKTIFLSLVLRISLLLPAQVFFHLLMLEVHIFL